ncbi:MAG: SDR family oxidoreductase [Planctomycetales bacterium]|nr:SDR family oxidoreductase [Planctomycetales bacterium]
MSESQEPTIHKLFDLSGKTALVSGGGGYLGAALASALAEAGARVALTSRTQERAEEAAAALPKVASGSHLGVELDHLRPESVDHCIEMVAQQLGSIDILVNNGNNHTALDWVETTPEEFTKQLSNATGYFQLARHVRRFAVEREAAASIVLIGSMYGVVGSYPDAYDGVCHASPIAYHTLKGGLVQMTRHLAVYWAKDRVRVNCLSPGPFPASTAPREMVKRLEAKSPMGRMGLPHELKGALLLLASDAGSYITGQNLLVDGGWTSW